MDFDFFTLFVAALLFFLIGRAYAKSSSLDGIIRKVFGFIIFLFILDIIFGSSNSQDNTNNNYGSGCDCDQDDDFFSNCNQDNFRED